MSIIHQSYNISILHISVVCCHVMFIFIYAIKLFKQLNNLP